MDRARLLLDELMGKNRDFIGTEDISSLIKDKNVCLYAIVEFCPLDLLYNTKLSFGKCPYSNHEYSLISYIKNKEHKISRKYFQMIIHKIIYQIEKKKYEEKKKLYNTKERVYMDRGVISNDKKDIIRVSERLNTRKVFKEGSINKTDNCINGKNSYDEKNEISNCTEEKELINFRELVFKELENVSREGYVSYAFTFVNVLKNVEVELEKVGRKYNIKRGKVCEVCSLRVYENSGSINSHKDGKLHKIIRQIRNIMVKYRFSEEELKSKAKEIKQWKKI